MKRPEKKEDIMHVPNLQHSEEALKRQGYNQCYDEFEKWITDNIEEMVIIMRDIQLSSSPGERAEDMNRRIAEALSKKLRGKG